MTTDYHRPAKGKAVSGCPHKDPSCVTCRSHLATIAGLKRRIRLARERFAVVDWDDGTAREDVQRLLDLRKPLAPKRRGGGEAKMKSGRIEV